MSSSGKAGNGRGNNRKKPFRRHNNDTWQEKDFSGRNPGGDPRSGRPQSGTPAKGNNASHKKGAENVRGERPSYVERPKWIPPKINTEPLPVSDCPWCGKPIRDISSAIADKDTGSPVHFDCVTSRIAFGERLEKGDTVVYIGGGRFGIVSFGSAEGAPVTERGFSIKKIIEWENKDKRAEWRSVICDHFSVT